MKRASEIGRWLGAAAPLVVACAAAMGAPATVAGASKGPTLLGAGGGEHGWIVLEGGIFAGDGRGARLYHLPGTSPAGTILLAQSLHAMTSSLGAGGARVILVYAPEAAEGAGRATVRNVRAVSVGPQITAGWFSYIPPEDQEVLASLPGEGRLEGIVESRDGAVGALLRADRPGDSSPTFPGGASLLLRLTGAEWDPIALPNGIDEVGALRLIHPGDAFGLVEIPRSGGARLWTMERPPAAPASSDAPPGGTAAAPRWHSEAIAVSADDELVSVEGVGVVAAKRDAAGGLRLELVRGEKRFDIAMVPGAVDPHVLLCVGETVVAAWVSPKDGQTLQITSVSAITGRTLHEGPAAQPSPIVTQDLQFLALLLGAVMLTVLIFVLRPEVSTREWVTLGPEFALAEPLPRTLAGAVDFLPCVAVAAKLWGQPFFGVLLMPFTVGVGPGSAAMWPFLAALGIMFVHSTISEWLWGRTLGKLCFGCRTMSVTGSGLTLWQAVSRNAVKAMAPPVALLVLLDPRRRHPGDVVSGTVVVSRVKEKEEQEVQ